MDKTQLKVECVCGRKLTKTSYGTSPVTIRCPRCGTTYKLK